MTTAATVETDQARDKRLRPRVQPGAPTTSITATLREDTRTEPRIPLLGIFQNQTWTDEFHDVPIYGNGALH